jgi:signal transduction histidine kinase
MSARLTARAIRDDDGRIAYVEGAISDETERKRSADEIDGARRRLQALSTRLVELQEAERRQIARELHDEIGQIVTVLKIHLESSLRLPEDGIRERIGDALGICETLLARVREMSLNLRPGMLDDLGLEPALLWHFEHYAAKTGLHVSFACTGLERRFPSEIETAAYRIVQEALTNVVRHAGVKDATVRIHATPGRLSIEIFDRGCGFDPAAALADHTRSGLAGMRERATLLGGQVVVESSAGSGTLLRAELPLADAI